MDFNCQGRKKLLIFFKNAAISEFPLLTVFINEEKEYLFKIFKAFLLRMFESLAKIVIKDEMYLKGDFSYEVKLFK